jgi:predicted metal-dependent phosphoesterase TrpH
MLRVEFHCHTIFSKDSLTKPETLVEVCRKKGIDRVIITDHNSIAGALAAREIDPTRVIVGEEIMTTRGEILAAFVQEEIAPGQTPQAVIDQLRQQGAFISVSHPFDRLRSGHWDLADLEEITPEVDAIEIFNSRCMESRFNQQALEYAQKYVLAGTVGSDAHAPFELGRATLSLSEFRDADELRTVIRSGKPDVRLSSPFVHFTSRYAVWKKAGKPRNPDHQ